MRKKLIFITRGVTCSLKDGEAQEGAGVDFNIRNLHGQRLIQPIPITLSDITDSCVIVYKRYKGKVQFYSVVPPKKENPYPLPEGTCRYESYPLLDADRIGIERMVNSRLKRMAKRGLTEFEISPVKIRNTYP